MKEIWKWVIGFRKKYKVSNFGRVKSVKRMIAGGNGGWRISKSKIMDTSPGWYGHLLVGLSKQGTHYTKLVHRLVLEAFVGPCPEGMECRHFPDRDPTNNRLDNLSWDTEQVNQLDRIEHGTDVRGEKHPGHKLSTEEVSRIRELYGAFTMPELASHFGVGKSQIFRIIRMRSRKHQ